MIPRFFYKKHIKDTKEKEDIAPEQRALLCNIRVELVPIIQEHNKSVTGKIYLKTFPLKHIYDRHIYVKKTPVDFYVILDNFENIFESPNMFYRNDPTKRGHFIVIKEINKHLYMSSIEVLENGDLEIVQASATGMNYLGSKKLNFTLLWSRGDG